MKPDSDVFIDLSVGTPLELEQQVADGGRHQHLQSGHVFGLGEAMCEHICF